MYLIETGYQLKINDILRLIMIKTTNELIRLRFY